MPSIMHRALRRVIRTGARPGLLGTAGRLCGRRIGWPLAHGPRIIIDRPDEFMQSAILWDGAYEPGIAGLLVAVLLPGDVFVDVGANAGQHSLIAASKKARVFAFEPVPRLARRLRDNVRLNRFEGQVTVVQMALAAHVGEATLYVADRLDDGSHSLLPGIPATNVEAITVPVTTLDTALAQRLIERPQLVKIDVEGAEALVLDGASALLATQPQPVVIVETGDRLARDIGESARSVLSRLSARDYKIYGVHERTGALTPMPPNASSPAVGNYVAFPSKHKGMPLTT